MGSMGWGQGGADGEGACGTWEWLDRLVCDINRVGRMVGGK